MPKLNQIEFVKADASHASFFPVCRALVDRTQGKNVFPADYYTQCIANPDQLLLLALLKGELVGVASARRLPSDGSAYYAPFGNEAVELFRQHRVGSMESASVEESWQGHGVGRELGRRRVAWLEEMGCDVIVGIAWESGSPHTSDRVFLRLGFEPLARVQDFYVNISVQRGFICPVCGPPPCRCSASLFVKWVKA
ncbi:MAG: GNAT family N-acetyltransferase, partial [Verrucomicrobiota bacterium]